MAGMRLAHPAGVVLPFDDASEADLLVPEVRGAICTGAYSAEMIRLLPAAVRPGDRVLVIGAGLGVVSTLIARSPGIDRVIALEADTALIPYLDRVHALNGVRWVETLNAVPGMRERGQVPFFVRRDLRASSLLPDGELAQRVMMVPLLDLGLILAEEQITLVVSEVPFASAQVLARIDLGPVERIAISDDSRFVQSSGQTEALDLLAHPDLAVEARSPGLLLRREPSVAMHSMPSAELILGTGT